MKQFQKVLFTENVLTRDDSDVTKFEVFPTNAVIPAGTYDSNIYTLDELPEPTKANYEKYINSIIKVEDKKYRLTPSGTTYTFTETTDVTISELFGHNFDVITGIAYTVNVDAAKTVGFTTKTYVNKEDSDIVIDWGDGKTSSIKDLTIGETVDGTTLVGYEDVESQDVYDDRKVQVKHEYDDAKCDYKYIITVYGKNYTTLRTYCSGATNICSRIFEYDLPISRCVLALSSVCANNDRLLRLNITEYYDFKNVINLTNAFSSNDKKSNLKTITVSDRSSIYYKNIDSFGAIFENCESLTSSNFYIPPNCTSPTYGYHYFYAGCKNLASNIKDLLPYKTGFIQRIVNICQAFNGCSKITGSLTEEFLPGTINYCNTMKLSDILWEDTSKVFIHRYGPFVGCTSLSDYDSIPTGWK